MRMLLYKRFRVVLFLYLRLKVLRHYEVSFLSIDFFLILWWTFLSSQSSLDSLRVLFVSSTLIYFLACTNSFMTFLGPSWGEKLNLEFLKLFIKEANAMAWSRSRTYRALKLEWLMYLWRVSSLLCLMFIKLVEVFLWLWLLVKFHTNL